MAIPGFIDVHSVISTIKFIVYFISIRVIDEYYLCVWNEVMGAASANVIKSIKKRKRGKLCSSRLLILR